MKIKISKSKWEEAGRKAGWTKTAGEDWMVNENYTKQIADELSQRGDKILSISGNNVVVVSHKVDNKLISGLNITVWEGSYEGAFILNMSDASNKKMIGMADGQNATEAIDNMDNQLQMIISAIGEERK